MELIGHYASAGIQSFSCHHHHGRRLAPTVPVAVHEALGKGERRQSTVRPAVCGRRTRRQKQTRRRQSHSEENQETLPVRVSKHETCFPLSCRSQIKWNTGDKNPSGTVCPQGRREAAPPCRAVLVSSRLCDGQLPGTVLLPTAAAGREGDGGAKHPHYRWEKVCRSQVHGTGNTGQASAHLKSSKRWASLAEYLRKEKKKKALAVINEIIEAFNICKALPCQ